MNMQTYFTIYNSNGVILRTGSCDDSVLPLQVGPWPGEFLLAEQSDSTTDAVDVVTKKIIPGGKVIAPISTAVALPADDASAYAYRIARKSIYPSINEQLDMLWHSMDTGDTPKSQPFYDVINAIKTANPKPDNSTI